MSHVVQYATPAPRPVLEKSRAGGLVAFGVISIVIAGGLVLIGSFGLVGIYMMAKMAPAQTAQVIPPIIGSMIQLLIIAALLLWVGIGSIRCRRWVRPVTLSLAWAWLASGLLAIVTTAAAGFGAPNNPATSTTVTAQGTATATPTTSATTPATVPATQPGAAAGWTATGTTTVVTNTRPPTAVVLGMLAGMALFAVALPLAYVLFYRGPNVRRTLEAYDPTPRWTDRLPTPVLGLAIWCALLALATAAGALGGYSDFFGNYLTGWNAAGVAALKIAMLAAAAALCFKRNPLGWWIALAYVLIWGTSIITTQLFGEVETIRPAVQAVGEEEQLHPIARRAAAALYATGAVAGIIYLLYVRRWFRFAEASDAPASTRGRLTPRTTAQVTT
jgi:hypothetical protein